MSNFTVVPTKEGNALIVRIAGNLNEQSQLTPLSLDGVSEVKLDLKEMQNINSSGIRLWVNWINLIPLTISVRFLNAPKCVIDQVNMVADFLGKKGLVESFYVPFSCETCDIQVNSLFQADKDIALGKKPLPVVPCTKCNKPTSIDVIEEKYFKFLKG